MRIYKLFVESKLHCDRNLSSLELSELQLVENPAELVARLRARLTDLAHLSVDDIKLLLDETVRLWSDRNHPVQRDMAELGLNFILYWFRRAHLEQTLDVALRGDSHVLDHFMALPGHRTKLFRAQPRGLVVHWLAGNIPVLGMLSLAQSLLTKNVNLVKVSRHNAKVLPLLLQSLSQVSIRNEKGQVIDGRDIAQTIAVVYFDYRDREANEWCSRQADVRLAWGGKEAIDTIINLPTSYGTEDIIFGPKYSYMVIGRDFLREIDEARDFAHRAATDVSLFDQYGCSSPHMIFVERGGQITPLRFAELLAEEMERVSRSIPKQPISTDEAATILKVRAEYDFLGKAVYPDNTVWTVLYSEHDRGLAEACYSRVVFVRPVDDAMEAADFADKYKQTVGVALSEERRLAFAERATFMGVERCPRVGQMNIFESPWDGMFAIDRLVRWVTTYSDGK